MITANRLHQIFRSSRDWNEFLRLHATPKQGFAAPRVALNESAVQIEVDLPGVENKDVDVEVEKNRLSIQIRMPEETGGQWKVRERLRFDQPFEFQFPFRIDSERSKVQLADGILTATIVKVKEDAPCKLTVKSESIESTE